MDVLDEKPFPREGPIAVVVEVVNVTNSDILACIELKHSPAGLIEFEVTDRDGKEVPILQKVDADVPIDEKANLIRLRPRERRSALLDLTGWGTVYDFNKGSYYKVVAIYSCPFDKKGTIGEKTLPIANQPERSKPKMFQVK